MSFKLWSELNNEALNELKPNFGFRSWNILAESDKRKIWKYLQPKYFFNPTPQFNSYSPYRNNNDYCFEFDENYLSTDAKQVIIASTIDDLNNFYKAKSFGKKFLENKTYFNSCVDFYSIFMTEDEAVVIEMLSFYGKYLIADESDKIREASKWATFDTFAADINEVFSHFGLRLFLSRLGFTPKQEDKILTDIYGPVLNSLSHPKWKEVNQHISDAFSEYRKNTQLGFSNCVTNTVTSVQAFLQIIVNGKTGSGDISKLIVQAQKQELIPADSFSKVIFKNIESILMRERQDTGIAHPKKEYATERNARLLLNVAMVFFQHCIQ
jgi:hypothetical protein